MNIVGAIATSVLVSFIAGCAFLQRNTICIDNRSQEVLASIEADFAGYVRTKDVISPGERYCFQAQAKRDGEIALKYLRNGKHIVHNLGYVAPPFTVSCRISVDVDHDNIECTSD